MWGSMEVEDSASSGKEALNVLLRMVGETLNPKPWNLKVDKPLVCELEIVNPNSVPEASLASFTPAVYK